MLDIEETSAEMDPFSDNEPRVHVKLDVNGATAECSLTNVPEMLSTLLMREWVAPLV